MSKTPFFSIIVPTCNRQEALQACLNNIIAGIHLLPEGKCEVIVSDDGNDTSERMLKDKFPFIMWIKGPHKGPAANRNKGADFAKGQWLVFIDDDCIPDTALLFNYYEAIGKHPAIKVFEGRVYVDRPKYSLGVTSPVNTTGGYLWACNFSIERKFFFSLNGFDTQFPYAAMEDVDLKLRINKTGNPILFLYDAAVCHPWRKKGGWKKVMQHNASSLLFLQKHPDERKKINSVYYLKFVTRTLVFDTIPGIFKYKGKGFVVDLVEHAGYLWMALKLFFKRN